MEKEKRKRKRVRVAVLDKADLTVNRPTVNRPCLYNHSRPAVNRLTERRCHLRFTGRLTGQ